MQKEILAELDQALNDILSIKKPTANLKNAALYDRLIEAAVAVDDICRGGYQPDQILVKQSLATVEKLRLSLAKSWAQQIETSEESLLELRSYPYLDNYWLLVNRELTLMHLTGLTLDNQSQILVIGDGALPLTICQILQHTGAHVDRLENDSGDLELGDKVLRVLGLAPHCTSLGDNYQMTSLDECKYDLVVINPTGDARNDVNILSRVLPALKLSGRLIVRSAVNARQLLLPSLSAERLNGYQLLLSYHPTDNIIPSSLIYRKQQS